MKIINKYCFFLIFLLVYLFFFVMYFWNVPLFPPDEPKYTFAAVKMLETGDYVTPYFNCVARLEKPILTYWLIVLSYKFFGVSDWASRLPFVVLSFFLLLTVYLSSKKELGEKVAIYASLFFVTNLQVFGYSKAVVPESPLLLFNTISTFLFYYGIRKENSLYITFAYIICGFGFLTKGPLSIIIPLGVNFPYFFVKKGGKKTIKSLLNPIGILLFLIITLTWYGPVTYIHKWKFIEEFFIIHNLKRFSGVASMHLYPFYYYLPVIFLSIYFWFPYLKCFLERLFSPQQTEFESFLRWWAMFVLIFFSIAKNKLHHYIIIIHPALSILMAAYLDRLNEKKIFSNILLIIMLIFELSVLLFGKKIIATIHYPIREVLLTSIIFSFIIIVSNNYFKNPFTFFLNVTKVLTICLIFLIYTKSLKNNIYNGMSFVKAEIVKGLRIYTYKRAAEDINFYLNTCTEKIDNNNELDTLISKGETFLLTVREKNLSNLKGYNYRFLYTIPSFKAKDRYLLRFN